MPYFLKRGKFGFALIFEQSRNQGSIYWGFCVALRQCCGSKFSPPRIRNFSRTGSRIRVKKFKYIPDPDPDFLPILDLGSRGQKGSESRIRIATLPCGLGDGSRKF